VAAHRSFARLQTPRHGIEIARRPGRLLLRRNHAWLRRDAGSRRPGPGAGPLDDHRLYPRTAVEPACRTERRARFRCEGAPGAKARGDAVNSPESHPAPSWQRLQRGAWAVGGASVVLGGAAALLDAEQVLRSYLAAFTFWL